MGYFMTNISTDELIDGLIRIYDFCAACALIWTISEWVKP